jgi:hypothetical protein
VAEGDGMSWGAELVKLRRMLRDPDASIWSDAFLRHLYNDVQQDFQHRTKVLEGVEAQRVPQTYQWSYQQDWEFRFLPATESQFYQCLNQHDEGVFCHRWETQQVTGITPDVADYGVHFTQAWEAYTSELPGDLVKMRFPANFNTMKFIAYDEEPIFAMSKKQVQSTDPSYVAKEGIPQCYFPYDQTDNSYVLYPRPSASFVNEAAGDGIAQFAEGDTEDVTTGLIATRSGSFDDGLGIPVDIVDVTNSVFMVYSVSPQDVRSVSDEPEFPVFLRKYIRSGVISRAYGGNNDGRIRSLSEYWQGRYMLGVQFVKRYNRNKKNDRDYRLTTKGSIAKRTVRHPRLPDGYPAV